MKLKKMKSYLCKIGIHNWLSAFSDFRHCPRCKKCQEYVYVGYRFNRLWFKWFDTDPDQYSDRRATSFLSYEWKLEELKKQVRKYS